MKKVKIGFTVNFEDVPEEVLQRLLPIRGEGDDQCVVTGLNEINVHLNNKDVPKALEEIDKVRNFLMDIDTKLGDAQSILEDYQQAIAAEKESKEDTTNDKS